MFWKKKKKSIPTYNVIESDWTTAYDFRLRSTLLGFESYRVAEYHAYHKLIDDEMLPRLDDHLDKLFAGDVDDGNGDILIGIILSTACEAIPDLARQRVDHTDMIRRLIVRTEVDLEDIKNLKSHRESELHDLQDEHAYTCRLIHETKKEVDPIA